VFEVVAALSGSEFGEVFADAVPEKFSGAFAYLLAVRITVAAHAVCIG
jgi:hypothetical protein